MGETSMNRRKPKQFTNCKKCDSPIPDSARSDAQYCCVTCRQTANKARFKAKHPDYVERQKRIVNEWRHKKEYGHTLFLDNPLLNKKDKFAAARSLGFRSLLEYQISEQLKKAGIGFKYENLKIKYKFEELEWDEDEKETEEEKW
jgi:hypothetical protein